MKIPIKTTPTIRWHNGKVKLIDQTKLPLVEEYIETDDHNVICDAIYRLAIRGAPAIGVAGAYACVLSANKIITNEREVFIDQFLKESEVIQSTRPTAVNLKWAVKKMTQKVLSSSKKINDLKIDLLRLANQIKDDDLNRCHQLANNGSRLIPDNANVITICNTGGLATSGVGTALGVIQYAHSKGKNVKVYVCETRPLLQGARLNTWELKRTKTPFTLMTDSMAAQTMKNKKIDGIFVGADRIASNGDTANKIGTYSLAVLANYHNIPFYVAAPLSTVDFEINSGLKIPVEERSGKELTRINGQKFTNEDFDTTTVAFDITPAILIKGIITEQGVAQYPYKHSLKDQKYE